MKASTKSTTKQLHGVGRRKNAVARVWVTPGKGKITVNGRPFDQYFDTSENRTVAKASLEVSGRTKNTDVAVNINGGGMVGQATAVRLGIARALLSGDEELRVLFRKHGFLTVDARVKERKKYGQRGARAKFQFVKR